MRAKMVRDLKKEFEELARSQGWTLLPNGWIAYLDFYGSAVFPMENGVALMFRFDGRRTGQTQPVSEQLQLGLTVQQCKTLAKQLLEGAEFLEREMTPPKEGKPN